MVVLMDFQDRAIRLTPERQKHIIEFTDSATNLTTIRETLLKPDVMTEAFHHPELRLFYRIYTRRLEEKRIFHVVVKVRGYDMLLVTAFCGKGFQWGGKTWKD